jgi:hypothetical protein
MKFIEYTVRFNVIYLYSYQSMYIVISYVENLLLQWLIVGRLPWWHEKNQLVPDNVDYIHKRRRMEGP